MRQITLYPWLKHSWHQLAGYLRQQRIPQALLLIGNGGIGKLQLAETYAQSLLCEAPTVTYFACGGCHSCRLFVARTHPDYFFIEPEERGKAIGIDCMRQLITKLTLKPQYQSHRCVVIDSADSLNNAAANAFLKCLEEPTERTSIVLLVKKATKLPATIRSRCQIMSITQPDTAVALEWLALHNVKNSARVLHMAQGAPLLAKQYADHNLLVCYDNYFNDWFKLAQGRINVVELAEQWHKQEAVTLSDLLSWMSQWVVAMIKLAYQVDCDSENKNALQVLLKRLDLVQLYRFYDLLLLGIQKQDTQLNKLLMIEQILIEWSRLNKR